MYLVNVLKFLTLYEIPYFFLPKFCFLCSCFLKYLMGMANSVDPDQTAQELSDLWLHCLHRSFYQKL